MAELDRLTDKAAKLLNINKDGPLLLHKDINLILLKQEHPSELVINPAGDQLYFLLNGVRTVGINDQKIETEAFIPSDDRLFYGLAVDPQNGLIYLSDAKDYVQRGDILIFSDAGKLHTQFKAGIIPASFYFHP